MNIFQWRRQTTPTTPSNFTQLDLERLDRSMNALKTTAGEVTQAAICAVKAIEDRLCDEELQSQIQRTKACYQALNSASDVITIVDREHRIFFCNDMFIEAFKVTDYKSCVGQLVEDVVGVFPTKMWNTVKKNKLWKGVFNQYDVSVLPIMNGEPQPIYYTCTFKKLTDKYISTNSTN